MLTPQPSDILTSSEKSSIQNIDRLLPSQTVMRKLFNGADNEYYGSLESILLSIFPVSTIEEKWNIELKSGVTYASLGSDTSTLHFYQLLIRLGGIKRVLELGTYIGVSTLFLAEAVDSDGRVTTVERGEEFFAIANRNFQRNRMENRIESILGNASQKLLEFAEQSKYFDMVLIDAAKESYSEMLPSALKCLSPGGLLVVDDIFMNGDTLNPEPTSAKGLGVRRLLELVSTLSPKYTRVILPIGNGSLLLRKPT